MKAFHLKRYYKLKASVAPLKSIYITITHNIFYGDKFLSLVVQ